MKNSQTFLVVFFVTCAAGLLIGGCMPAEPTRKKLPVLLSNDGIESGFGFGVKKQEKSWSGYGFTVSNTELSVNGLVQPCVSVSMPDAESDVQAMNLLAMYKPFAVTMLTEWSKQNRNGVVVDMRSNILLEGSRADYMVEKQDLFSFPLIFLWDNYSAARASSYMSVLNDVPGVKIRRTDIR
jgi:hypothetical protein